ncbi:MAG TPA: hypothetical protein PK156_25160 [Polyangium sp.]|nr:hypothetical protein [Polyangium sp.]
MKRGWLLSIALGGMLGLAGIASCGTDGTGGTTTDPCPNGLCGAGGSGGESSGSTSSSGSMASGSSSGAGGSTGCVEAWLCSPWQTDSTSNNGTRTCTDLNNCGTTATKPPESAMLPALDLDFYKCNVEPIFDRGCAQLACHGTETGRALRIYARGRHRITGEMLLVTGCNKPAGTTVPSESCEGGIECACWTAPHTPTEWQRNFDAARGFGLDTQGTPIPAGQEDTSELISQPIIGGKAHAGIKMFASGDPEHQTLKQWLSGAKLGMTCTSTN